MLSRCTGDRIRHCPVVTCPNDIQQTTQQTTQRCIFPSHLLSEHLLCGHALVTDQGEFIDRPSTDIDLELTGTGQTTRQLAATLDGSLHMTQGEGKIERASSGILTGDLFAQIIGAINPLKKDKRYGN